MVAGTSSYMMRQGRNLLPRRRRAANGQVVYQSRATTTGATIKTLPAERVLVTVSGTTYYLAANAFYRRIVSTRQESFA